MYTNEDLRLSNIIIKDVRPLFLSQPIPNRHLQTAPAPASLSSCFLLMSVVRMMMVRVRVGKTSRK